MIVVKGKLSRGMLVMALMLSLAVPLVTLGATAYPMAVTKYYSCTATGTAYATLGAQTWTINQVYGYFRIAGSKGNVTKKMQCTITSNGTTVYSSTTAGVINSDAMSKNFYPNVVDAYQDNTQVYLYFYGDNLTYARANKGF